MGSHAAFIGSIPEAYDRYLGPLLFEPYANRARPCSSTRRCWNWRVAPGS